eukprot:244528-Prorocentrum_minimum.AAC.2
MLPLAHARVSEARSLHRDEGSYGFAEGEGIHTGMKGMCRGRQGIHRGMKGICKGRQGIRTGMRREFAETPLRRALARRLAPGSRLPDAVRLIVPATAAGPLDPRRQRSVLPQQVRAPQGARQGRRHRRAPHAAQG